MVFPVVMYGCESWTVKKAQCWRIDAFELWCWRRLLRVPWTARRSNQSILKEISPGCSLEGMMLKLKLQYFGHLMWGPWLIGKDSDAGRDWGQEEKGMTGWDGWMASPTRWTRVGDGQGGLEWGNSWGRKESDMTERLNWTEQKKVLKIYKTFLNHAVHAKKKKFCKTAIFKNCHWAMKGSNPWEMGKCQVSEPFSCPR